jgi:hypothetical protein
MPQPSCAAKQHINLPTQSCFGLVLTWHIQCIVAKHWWVHSWKEFMQALKKNSTNWAAVGQGKLPTNRPIFHLLFSPSLQLFFSPFSSALVNLKKISHECCYLYNCWHYNYIITGSLSMSYLIFYYYPKLAWETNDYNRIVARVTIGYNRIVWFIGYNRIVARVTIHFL